MTSPGFRIQPGFFTEVGASPVTEGFTEEEAYEFLAGIDPTSDEADPEDEWRREISTTLIASLTAEESPSTFDRIPLGEGEVNARS